MRKRIITILCLATIGCDPNYAPPETVPQRPDPQRELF